MERIWATIHIGTEVPYSESADEARRIAQVLSKSITGRVFVLDDRATGHRIAHVYKQGEELK